MRYKYYVYSAGTGIKQVKTKLALAGTGLALLIGSAVLSFGVLGTAHAASGTTIIRPNNIDTVFSNITNTPTSSYDLVSGPAQPPLGSGSLELTTSDSNGHQQHLEAQQTGASLSSIDAMSYSTYRHSDSTGSMAQVPAIDLEIFTNATAPNTGYTTLVFEPIYNTAQGAIANDTWQSWDAYKSGDAVWWSSHAIPGVCADSCYVSWSSIVASNPKATVIDYGIGQGSGNPGIHANVDALSIGVSGNTTTYDFEPAVVASGNIVSPTSGQHVTKTLNLIATYNDGDVPNTDDGVQWAVRQGTCAAGTGTVFGNVDGHHDSDSWNGNNFSATLDVRNLTPGQYCFVFNPTDDPGQPNVRLTQTFYIDAYVPSTLADCNRGGWKTYVNPSFKNKGKCIQYVWNHSHSVHGYVDYTAYGLKRTANFWMNTALNRGVFLYHDANHGSYRVKVSSVKVNGDIAYFAGVVQRASNPAWVGQWLFGEVQNGHPDKIWGSFTNQSTAQSGVANMTNPSDGPFSVTKGNLTVH